MKKAFKFRIYPNNDQINQIQRTFGCCRFVYNYFLNQRINHYEKCGDSLNFALMCQGITVLKNNNDKMWLREVDSTALQSSVKDLDMAYQNFFRRKKHGKKPGFPKFKSKKNMHKSYKTKNVDMRIKVYERHIKLPKLGLVRAAISKVVEGRILNATISQSPSGKYFVSLCCTDVSICKYSYTGAKVGLDLGITTLLITSDGVEYSNRKHLKQSEMKLAKLQRQLSRKQIGSNNRNKARVKVARLQEKIANKRMDVLHKLSTQLVKDYDVICVEDLAVKNMIRNHNLAKSISDASWGELNRQLRYKCEWQNKEYVKINRAFASSQICNNCGYKNSDVKDLSVRLWKCPECESLLNRDENAAINILHEGLRLIA